MTKENIESEYVALLLRRQTELSILLELTRRIISSNPEENLFKILERAIYYHVGVDKIKILYKEEEKLWLEKSSLGVDYFSPISIFHLIYLTESYQFPGILSEQEQKHFTLREFKFIVPVFFNKDQQIIVLLGNSNLPKKEVSYIDFDLIRILSHFILVGLDRQKVVKIKEGQKGLLYELNMASQMYGLLLPKNLPNHDRYQIDTAHLLHKNIGGDFYDYIPISEHYFLYCIADVMGKGVGSAMLMASFQAGIRTLGKQRYPLDELLHLTNQSVFEITKGTSHLTVFIAYYNNQTRCLTYINAGHNPPLLINSDLEMFELKNGSIPLGLFKKLPFIDVVKKELPKNSIICHYTDGIIEFNSENSHLLSEQIFKNWLREVIPKTPHPSQINSFILEKIRRRQQQYGIQDDVTLLTLRVF